MTALETPSPDAPAKEWGSLAVRIPGWRWPISTDSAPEPDMPGLFRIGRLPWRSTRCAQFRHQWSQHDGKGECVPDPDHWAWWGWLLRLLGPRCLVRVRILPLEGPGRYEVVIPSGMMPDGRPHRVSGINLGRACIAAATGVGRWPGGAS